MNSYYAMVCIEYENYLYHIPKIDANTASDAISIAKDRAKKMYPHMIIGMAHVWIHTEDNLKMRTEWWRKYNPFYEDEYS